MTAGAFTIWNKPRTVRPNGCFGEKTTVKIKGKSYSVTQTAKYLKSKAKAIELIETGKYNLDESDFWILQNTYNDSMLYSGLIITHTGCLKINDVDDEIRVFLMYKLCENLRDLSQSRIKYNENGNDYYIDGQELVNKLKSPEMLNSINMILSNNKKLLIEESPSLSKLVDRELIIDGSFSPLEENEVANDLHFK